MNPTTLLSGLGAAITAEPALGGASTTGRESNPGGGDLFLALVNGLLQGSTQEDLGSVPDPTAATAGPSTEAAAADLPVADATGDAAPDPAADELESAPAVEVPTDLSMLQLALAVTPSAVPAAVPATAGRAGQGEPAPAVTSVDGGTPAPTATPTVSPSAVAAPAPSLGDSSQTGTGTGTDQQSAGDPATTADGPAPTPADTGQASAAAPAGPQVEPRADAVPTQPAAAAPVGVVAPASAAAAVTTPTTSVALPRVADQVFPEVLRATSNADNGTSRVTVKLNPESLGEVRVVLTQRGGQLEVTLAGGTDARRALTEGAPELHRLLESVGRTDSRIFIRDLPTTVAGPTPVVPASGAATRTDVSTDLAGGAWSGAGSPGGEPAPDRDGSRHRPGSSTATEGIPGVTPRSRPTQTAGRSHAGLDLSM